MAVADCRHRARLIVAELPPTIRDASPTSAALACLLLLLFSVGQNEKYNAKDVEERRRDHALFVAFAPLEAPRIAVAVVIENGESGSKAAAPIARAVMEAYLQGATPTPGTVVPAS